MSRALLIACSVVLVVVLFCPIIVWSQTAPIFTVIGTVVDSKEKPVDNGLAVEVQNANTGATVYGVTGGISNAHLLSEEIIVGKGQFAVVFPPFEKGDRAAAVDDKIIVKVHDGLYMGKEFSYNVTKSNIESGKMEIRIPYYTFTLSLVEGINLISIPLAEATVEGGTVKIERVSDLGKLLGGSWSLIISSDCGTGKFMSYTPATPPGVPLDVKIDGYTGLIVVMKEKKTLELIGKGWDVDGKDLPGKCKNMIGIPLKDDNLVRVSDLGESLGDRWNLIISYDREASIFRSYTPTTRPDAKSNIVIDGDTGLIVVTKEPCSFSVKGEPWSDENRRLKPLH